MPAIRPAQFRLNTSSPLAQGLVFAGLGQHAGSVRYHDSSLYGHHGSLSSDIVWQTDGSLYLPGNDNNGITVDGSGDQKLLQDALTFAVWVNAPDDVQQLFNLGPITNSRPACYLKAYSGRNLLVYLGSSNLRYFSNSINLSNDWHHVAATIPGSEQTDINSSRCFVDGVELAVASTTATGVQETRYNVFIGLGSADLEGYIRDPMFWDRVLSPAEIQALADPSNVLLDGLIEPVTNRSYFIFGAGTTAYSITADSGTFTLTGQATGLLADRTIAAGQGSYTLTGQATGLLKGHTLTAGQGSYTLSGQSTGLLKNSTIAAGQGSVTLSGQSAGLLVGRKVAAEQGSYTLSGQDTGLKAGRKISLDEGTFAVSGQDVTLTATEAATGGQSLIVTLGLGQTNLLVTLGLGDAAGVDPTERPRRVIVKYSGARRIIVTYSGPTKVIANVRS
jgi:hypothetical protein